MAEPCETSYLVPETGSDYTASVCPILFHSESCKTNAYLVMPTDIFPKRYGLPPAADCAAILEDGPVVSDPEPLARNTLREDLILGRLHAPGSAWIPRI